MKPKSCNLVFIVILAATLFLVSIGCAKSEVDWWPMFQHDANHSGFSMSEVPAKNETLWVFDIGSLTAARSYLLNRYRAQPA